MVYTYYSPVGTTLTDSEQRAEILTKRTTVPAASVAKAVYALILYAI